MYRKIASNLENYMLLIGSLFLITTCSMDPNEKDADLPSKGQATPAIESVDLADRGPAAEFENQVWLNVEQPLRLQELRGKVVLLDFWTFG